jgi:hypothetical protein
MYYGTACPSTKEGDANFKMALELIPAVTYHCTYDRLQMTD